MWEDGQWTFSVESLCRFVTRPKSELTICRCGLCSVQEHALLYRCYRAHAYNKCIKQAHTNGSALLRQVIGLLSHREKNHN